MSLPPLKLSYKILSISSCEENNFANQEQISLVNNNPWRSEKFCTYPQFIYIQFGTPVNIRQINILVHEQEIPNRIDFNLYYPKGEISFNKIIGENKYRNFPYINFGYVILNDNSDNNFQSREFKRIFIDEKCLFLRLDIGQNYINDFNQFQQVCLLNLEFFGNDLPGFNNYLVSITNQQTENEKINKFVDEITEDKITRLKNYLEFTEDNSKLNDYVTQIKDIGKNIYNLQIEKNKAVTTEDYDLANELKNKIDSLYLQMQRIGIKNIKNDGINNITHIVQNSNNNSVTQNQNDSNNINLISNENINNKSNSSIHISEKDINTSMQYDDMIIPSVQKQLNSKNENTSQYDIENSQDLYEVHLEPLEELEKDTIETYQLLIPYIEEIGLQKLLSNQMVYKNEGFEILTKKLSAIFSADELNEILPLLFKFIAGCLEDKNNSMTLKAFELLQNIFRFMSINLDKISQEKRSISFINSRVIQKIRNNLGNGVEKIRNKATELYLFILYHPAFFKFDTLLNDLLIIDLK